MKYKPEIVTAHLKEFGIAEPVYEYKFHPTRRWRLDLAWPDKKVAVEVQGGIFVSGRHSRGAALLKEWEKLNTAAMNGWRILYCQPKDLCTSATAFFIKESFECLCEKCHDEKHERKELKK